MSLRTRAWHARQRALEALVPGQAPVAEAGPPRLDGRYLDYLLGQGTIPVPVGATGPSPLPATTSAPRRADVRRSVRAGLVADALTAELLAPEWQVVDIHRQGWQDVLTAQAVDLLLVQVPGTDPPPDGPPPLQHDVAALRELIGACTAAGVPVVLWDTGGADPARTRSGACSRPAGVDDVARLADVVAAADPQVLRHYLDLLPPGRVLHLPPAVQPRLHNPLRAAAGPPGGTVRRDVLHRRHERDEALRAATVTGDVRTGDVRTGDVLSGDLRTGDVLSGVADEAAAGAREREDHGLELDVATTVRAFGSHRVVVQHGAGATPLVVRESLEAVACGALPVRVGPVGPWEPLVGLVVSADDAEQAETVTRQLLADPAACGSQTRLARRAARRQHTMSHRVDTMLRAVGLPVVDVGASVCAVVVSRPGDDLTGVLTMLGRQDHADLAVVVAHLGPDHVPTRESVRERAGNDRTEVQGCAVDLDDQGALLAVARGSGARYLLAVDPRDLYLPGFVSELVAASDWAEVAGVGKATVITEHTYPDEPELPGDLGERVRTWLADPGHEDVLVDHVVDATLLVERQVLLTLPAAGAAGPGSLSARLVAAGHRVLSTDRYSYVRRRRVPGRWQPAPAPLLQDLARGTAELMVPGCGELVARG